MSAGRKGNVELVSILILLLYFLLQRSLVYKTQDEFLPMSVTAVEDLGSSARVVLTRGCYVMSFYTTAEQGRSIKMALNGTKALRPSTHELIVMILRKFSIEVEELKITKLERGIYYAELTLRGFGMRYELDVRPSDGIAIALRTNSPIKVHKNLLKNTCSSSPF